MNMSKKQIGIGVAVIVIVLVGVQQFAEKQTAHVVSALEENLKETYATTRSISKATLRNDVSAPYTGIIRECDKTSQDAFDRSLTNLTILSEAELDVALFQLEACAYTAIEEKTLMLQLLSDGVASIEEQLVLLKRVAPLTSVDSVIEPWRTVVQLEQKRLDIMNQQVSIQRDIITELKAGVRSDSPEITALTTQAQELVETYSVVTVQLQTAHQALPDV